MQLRLFNTSHTEEFKNLIDVLKHLKEFDYFLNASNAYRILLTIPVTLTYLCRNEFSKFEVIKILLTTHKG